MNLREASLTKTHEPDKQVFPPLRRGRETNGGREGGTKNEDERTRKAKLRNVEISSQ